MKNKFRFRSIIFLTLVLLASGLLPRAVRAADPYDPNTLSYGLYWFGENDANQKFVAGETNPYFDPAKPTLIFVHGWQPYLSASLPGFDYDGTDTAAAWINDGWNVGIFVWNQFSDETTGVLAGGDWFSGAPPQGVQDAEAKIWTPDGPQGMRWRDWDELLPPLGDGYSDAPAGTPSAAELFYQAYVAALTEQEYTGGHIRVAGHSLGNQMAVRLTKLVHDEIAAGHIPEHLRPTRVALLDPYWSPEAKDYLGGKTNGEMVREYVSELLPTSTLFEWYWSSAWTTAPEGDANDALKPMVLYAEMDPAHESSDMNKHLAAQHLYFWAYAFDGPPECAGDVCLEPAKMLSKMSDARLAALLRSDYTWAQSAGSSSATPDDDVYQATMRPAAPYTITQLVASSSNPAIGETVTLTATVEGQGGAPADDGTLVAFAADLGDIPARGATSGGVVIVQITSDVAGTAHITATTEGAGGTTQNSVTVTFGAADTPTPTATGTATETGSPTPTATSTTTPTATSSATVGPSPTATSTPTATSSPTAGPSVTATSTPTATPTGTPTPGTPTLSGWGIMIFVSMLAYALWCARRDK